jgi:methylglutaconyl-CoA hydratase
MLLPREEAKVSEKKETIRIERSGEVVRVVLNRPDIRNSFNDVMINELRETFAELKEQPGVRVVVLTGEGKAFCAGADLNWMKRVVEYSYEENYDDSYALAQLMREIYDFPLPVVGRINGPAIGGGTGLVAVCDIVVAVERAVFAFSEVKIGLVPACISPYVLKRIGERYGREYFLTGKRLSAEEAEECGLVNRVVPADELDDAVDDYVRNLVNSGPEAVATSKRMVQQVSELTLDEAGPFTADMIARIRMSDEGQEGMNAFLQRRKPSWGDR